MHTGEPKFDILDKYRNLNPIAWLFYEKESEVNMCVQNGDSNNSPENLSKGD